MRHRQESGTAQCPDGTMPWNGWRGLVKRAARDPMAPRESSAKCISGLESPALPVSRIGKSTHSSSWIMYRRNRKTSHTKSRQRAFQNASQRLSEHRVQEFCLEVKAGGSINGAHGPYVGFRSRLKKRRGRRRRRQALPYPCRRRHGLTCVWRAWRRRRWGRRKK